MKKFPLISNLNLSRHNLSPFPLVLLILPWGKSLTPTPGREMWRVRSTPWEFILSNSPHFHTSTRDAKGMRISDPPQHHLLLIWVIIKLGAANPPLPWLCGRGKEGLRGQLHPTLP